MTTLLAACAGSQSVLDPAGPSARAIAEVWWWMLWGAMLVTGAVICMVAGDFGQAGTG
jgi:hypothetical protein